MRIPLGAGTCLLKVLGGDTDDFVPVCSQSVFVSWRGTA